MTYSERLADRIREALAREKGVDEIKMMGGLCFMIGGHMALGIIGEELTSRVRPDRYQRVLGRLHAREMEFTGRPMKGYVFVEPAGIRTSRSLATWVAPRTQGVCLSDRPIPVAGAHEAGERPRMRFPQREKRTFPKEDGRSGHVEKAPCYSMHE